MPDRCAATDNGLEGLRDDDTCLTGENHDWHTGGDGFGDWCTGDKRASDGCWSGKDEDDLCYDKGDDYGVYDTCPGGGTEVDKCGILGPTWYPLGDRTSDDYCVEGKSGSDECPDGKPPEDECAGGVPTEDVCYMHIPESDECDGSIAGSDQGGGVRSGLTVVSCLINVILIVPRISRNKRRI